MILEEFDDIKEAIINPDMIVEKIENFPEITISCFSNTLFQEILSKFEPVLIANIHSAVNISPVYEVKYKNTRFAFFQSQVGEPKCIGDYEELIAMGSKCLILFGNCGILDKNIDDCKIIIPTRAIRDEGCSYHYCKPSDYINVNNKYVDLFEKMLNKYNYDFVKGTTWTNDAFYRETKNKVEKRKDQGAICVEMECAGMQALCNFRNTEFFQFLYAGDNLDNETWDPRSLSGKSKLNEKIKIAQLPFELGLEILNKKNA